MSKIILILVCITTVRGYHYNGYPYSKNWPEAPRYPDHCCPLEWVNMTQGKELPNDWIEAGTFMGRKFAFSRSDYPNLDSGVKSERKEDSPYAFGNFIPNPFPILTNPNKCFVDWHTTKSVKEIPLSTDRIFFPSAGYSKYGDYAQHDGIPGNTHNGDGKIAKLTSLNNAEWKTVQNKKLLYVDCAKSFDSMYNLILTELKFNQEAIIRLKRSSASKQYLEKLFKNDSPETSTITMNFFVPTSKYLNLTLNTFDGFALNMNENEETSLKFVNSSLVNKLLADVGFQEDQYVKKEIWNVGQKWGINGSNTTSAIIMNAFNERKSAFKPTLNLPPYSSAIVTALRDPIVGRVPFTAVYELVPKKAGDNLITIKMLTETITKRFKFHELMKFRESDNGSPSIKFEGTMSIDAGSDVYLKIVTEQFHGRNFTTSTGDPINTTTVEYIY